MQPHPSDTELLLFVLLLPVGLGMQRQMLELVVLLQVVNVG
jgi:hypothetical protein